MPPATPLSIRLFAYVTSAHIRSGHLARIKRRWAQDSVRVRPQAPRGRCAFLAIETGRGLLPAHALAGEHENNSRLSSRVMSQANGRTVAPQLRHQPKPPHSLPPPEYLPESTPLISQGIHMGTPIFLETNKLIPQHLFSDRGKQPPGWANTDDCHPFEHPPNCSKTRRKPLLTQFQDFFFTTFS